MRGLLAFFLGLAIASLSPGASCHNIQALVRNLENGLSFQNALSQEPSLQRELGIAAASLKGLWTSELPAEFNLSSECQTSVDNLDLSSVGVLLDATGKQGAGLLSGNLAWDGAYDECLSYNFTSYCVASYISLPKENLSLPWTIGLCVPKYCKNTDVAKVINSMKVLAVESHKVYCEDSKIPQYNAGTVIMTIVTTMFSMMVIVGTITDYLLHKFPLFFSKDGTKPPGGNEEKTPLLRQTGIMKKENTSVDPWDFVTAFSLFKTLPTLLATKQGPSVITCLNGLRVISMFWVILGHAHVWTTVPMPQSIDNPVNLRNVMSRFSFQPVVNGFFAVDTFFFLSGVLVTYLSLHGMKNKHGKFPFLHFYIHRFLRLTPTYAFVLFFMWSFYYHIAYSPHIALTPESSMGQCGKYWWTNFLYINNLHPWELVKECMPWTWYLSNDMQFYIISPLILLPLYYIFPLGLILVGALLLSSFVVTASLVGVFDLESTIFASIAYNHSDLHASKLYTNLVYTKPWCRVAPYLVGMVLGFALYRQLRLPFSKKRKLNVLVYFLMWIAAGVILGLVLYGLYFAWHGHALTKAENVLYVTFSRFAWAIGLALIVFACHNGYGGIINSFLSMKIWTPLARMTYNAYLIHPVVLSIIIGQFQKTYHYTDITMAFFVVGLVVISFAIAAVVCMLVEIPLGTIEMLVFKLVGLKSRRSQRQATEAGTHGNQGAVEEEKGELEASKKVKNNIQV